MPTLKSQWLLSFRIFSLDPIREIICTEIVHEVRLLPSTHSSLGCRVRSCEARFFRHCMHTLSGAALVHCWLSFAAGAVCQSFGRAVSCIRGSLLRWNLHIHISSCRYLPKECWYWRAVRHVLLSAYLLVELCQNTDRTEQPRKPADIRHRCRKANCQGPSSTNFLVANLQQPLHVKQLVQQK